jgi:hypothetical protein
MTISSSGAGVEATLDDNGHTGADDAITGDSHGLRHRALDAIGNEDERRLVARDQPRHVVADRKHRHASSSERTGYGT